MYLFLLLLQSPLTLTVLVKYALMQEVADSNALCEYVKLGNRADVVIEFHSVNVTGVSNMRFVAAAVKEKLTACGVNMHDLAANWHR
jgi:hypothetical protein